MCQVLCAARQSHRKRRTAEGRYVAHHTTQNSLNKWTKISSTEIDVFQLKNDSKKWSRIYFEIDRAPSEIPANLPGQFSLSGHIFLLWAAATLKGLGGFQNKKSRPQLPSFLSKNGDFKTRDFSPLIQRVLASVSSFQIPSKCANDSII